MKACSIIELVQRARTQNERKILQIAEKVKELLY